MTPGAKVAIISKSAPSDTHVSPSDDKLSEGTGSAVPAEKKIDTQVPKSEVPKADKLKTPPPPPPPKISSSEPQLPPKEKERRVGLI